ncbi:phage capsid protein [Planomonospora sp. ID67723]|uniref:phage minor capsid protein n=1 Tax=Planomonospora sp. ID67723 TaxID=2738134 RepID=UPI0018C35B4B|nr:phage minor capsid protein [Planomonospora sp. ID67723]MBG0830523.1 phage capsid protein [Planomonospora sp. ID67723]
MAVDQDLLDQIAATIADLYRDVEAALITMVAAELRKGLDSPTQERRLDAVRKLQAAARLLLASLQAARAGTVRDTIARAYRDGYGSAIADLPERWFPKSGIGQAARDARDEIPNAHLLENIAQALHRDLGRVDGNILRAPIDAYRAVQAGAAARIASGIVTRREASQAAWQRLMDQGITSFTDRANRRWRLSSYVEMIGRTNIARAAIQGQTDRLASLGIDLVYVSDNVQECKRCRPFEGQVLRRDHGPTGRIQVEHATRDDVMVTVHVLDTLDGARARGFQHPNCRHSVSAYLPGVTKPAKHTADPDGERQRQKQRALERKIRAAKEQALGALTPEAKKAANAKVRAAQAELRAHLAAHPNLKRLTYREQAGAGNIPRAGGPKGGPVVDLQPPVQQRL